MLPVLIDGSAREEGSWMMIQRREALCTDSCDNWSLKYKQRAIVLSLFPSIVILIGPQ